MLDLKEGFNGGNGVVGFEEEGREGVVVVVVEFREI